MQVGGGQSDVQGNLQQWPNVSETIDLIFAFQARFCFIMSELQYLCVYLLQQFQSHSSLAHREALKFPSAAEARGFPLNIQQICSVSFQTGMLDRGLDGASPSFSVIQKIPAASS